VFDYSKVDDVISRIADVVHPSRIIVFGSVARRDAGPESDLDLLVLFKEPFNYRDMYRLVKSQFIGLRLASDIILMTECDFCHYLKDEYSFSFEISKTGEVVYAE